MPQQKPAQCKIIGKVMHDFKKGALRSGSGARVKNPKQAIAVALSEAGASRATSPDTQVDNVSSGGRRYAERMINDYDGDEEQYGAGHGRSNRGQGHGGWDGDLVAARPQSTKVTPPNPRKRQPERNGD